MSDLDLDAIKARNEIRRRRYGDADKRLECDEIDTLLAEAGLLRGEPQTVVSRTTGFSASAINMALLRARVRFGAKSTPHLVLVLERLGFIDEDLNVKERLI